MAHIIGFLPLTREIWIMYLVPGFGFCGHVANKLVDGRSLCQINQSIKTHLFIWKAVTKEERDGRKKSFTAGWSFRWLQQPGLGQTKTRNVEFLPGISNRCRSPYLAISHCFPRDIYRELDWKRSSWDMVLKWDAAISGSGLASCGIMQATKVVFFINYI